VPQQPDETEETTTPPEDHPQSPLKDYEDNKNFPDPSPFPPFH
jgi:hypothetical protein